ncbi:hypothetical protein WKT22_02306 [Candidatus Lokiarchaeum ossiferum]
MEKAFNHDFVNTIWKIIDRYIVSDAYQGLLFRKRNKEDLIKFRISSIEMHFFWSSKMSVLDEMKRIFYRLTQKPVDSYVPLWDLIDERPLKEKLNKRTIFVKENVYGVLKAILFYTAKEITFPVEYDAENAVFIKKSDTFDLISQLDSNFADWERNVRNSFGKS